MKTHSQSVRQAWVKNAVLAGLMVTGAASGFYLSTHSASDEPTPEKPIQPVSELQKTVAAVRFSIHFR